MQLGISSYTYTWSIGVPGSLPDKQMLASDLVARFRFDRSAYSLPYRLEYSISAFRNSAFFDNALKNYINRSGLASVRCASVSVW